MVRFFKFPNKEDDQPEKLPYSCIRTEHQEDTRGHKDTIGRQEEDKSKTRGTQEEDKTKTRGHKRKILDKDTQGEETRTQECKEKTQGH